MSVSQGLLEPCPCGSKLSYRQCCQRLHDGEPACSPTALMRSRFCAFSMGLNEYLQHSWHPKTRPASVSIDPQQQWLRLDILNSTELADTGSVHFRATGRESERWFVLEEKSVFERYEGHWYYVQGTYQSTELTPGRNVTCPCGSGRKYKKCCSNL